MAIEIITGDLLDALDRKEVRHIGHCANMQNTFGSGIAKSIRERFPRAYKADTEWFNLKPEMRPPLSIGGSLEEGWIYNLYGQVNYGREKRQVHYGLLANALITMGRSMVPGALVGFPYLMACDRAGGDWDVVLELIETAFAHCHVKIYKLEKPI
jgi:hypothetical protein